MSIVPCRPVTFHLVAPYRVIGKAKGEEILSSGILYVTRVFLPFVGEVTLNPSRNGNEWDARAGVLVFGSVADALERTVT